MNQSTFGKLVIETSDNITLKGTPTVEGNVVTITATATGSGAATISGAYDGTQAFVKNTTIKPTSAVMVSITPDKPTIDVGEDVVLTLAFDKALVAGQAEPTIQIPTGLTEKVAFALSETRDGGTITLTADTTGDYTVSAILGGVTKTAAVKVAVVDPVLESATPSASSIEIGQDVTITATFDKAPDIADVTFTPSAELQLKTDKQLVGNTVVVVYTAITASSAASVDVDYKSQPQKQAVLEIVSA